MAWIDPGVLLVTGAAVAGARLAKIKLFHAAVHLFGFRETRPERVVYSTAGSLTVFRLELDFAVGFDFVTRFG